MRPNGSHTRYQVEYPHRGAVVSLQSGARWICRLGLLLSLLLFYNTTFANDGEIRKVDEIRFEYSNFDSTLAAANNPLIICIPGFTQHNRSAEFLILKNFFKQLGFSFLIMNPPQHGEDISYKQLFDWGNREVQDVVTLIRSLRLLQKHKEVHLLGFSIGAKVVLKLGATAGLQDSFTSVIAVAAPYRVSEINLRPSGSVSKLLEGVISGFYAYDRSSLGRFWAMALLGLPTASVRNTATPANEIAAIRVPALLLHSADDWLTKSFHSKKLFRRGRENQPLSFVSLAVKTHAEDMLTRDHSRVRKAFLDILDNWIEFIRSGNFKHEKTEFDAQFKRKLGKTIDTELLYPVNKISMMGSPAIHEFNSDLWLTAVEHNHSMITLNSVASLNGNHFARHLLTFGSTKTDGRFWQRLRGGLSFQQNQSGRPENFFGNVSLYYPFGSIIWLRRISYAQKLGNGFDRRFFSTDLAFLVLDFQVNYGNFINDEYDLQLNFNFPLVGNAANSYLFGIGYSRFLSDIPGTFYKNNLKVYLLLGPSAAVQRTRVRAIFQYEQEGFNPSGAAHVWSAGLSFNFDEQ